MARVVLFAAIRQAAQCRHVQIGGDTVNDVLQSASARFGPEFTKILGHCTVFLGDTQVGHDTVLRDDDEIAILPPVSGG